jgi:signal transduction histidine kinase
MSGLSEIVLKETSDYVAVTDFKGILKFVNPSYEKLGYKLGESGLDYVHSEDKKKVITTIANAEHGKKETLTYRTRNKKYEEGSEENKWLYFETTADLIIYEGEKQAVLISKDVTEKMKALKEKSKFEELKKNFITIAYHELIIPFNVIYGTIELLHMGAELDKKDIEKAYFENKRLMNMLNNFQEFFKIDNIKNNLNKKYNDIKTIIKDSIDEEIVLYSHQKNIRICVSGDNGLLYLDKTKIIDALKGVYYDVFKNSQSNKSLNINLNKFDEYFQISITAESVKLNMQDYFSKYYVAKEYKEESQGLGLGLYLANKMIEFHNGILEVKYEEELESSIITIKLPFNSQ